MRIFFNLRPPHAHPAASACRLPLSLLGGEKGVAERTYGLRRENVNKHTGDHTDL
jgi:hypothetical protein